MNARYQKNSLPEGKTRKSAAAAKPKKASSSGTSKSSSSSKSTGGKRPSAYALRNPETPEFKAYRRTWWISLGIGLALTAVSWALQTYVHTSWARVAQALTLGAAYAAIIYAFYIDWTKMRPLRKAAYEQQRSGKAPKPAEKPAKAESKTSKSSTESTDSGDTAE